MNPVTFCRSRYILSSDLYHSLLCCSLFCCDPSPLTPWTWLFVQGLGKATRILEGLMEMEVEVGGRRGLKKMQHWPRKIMTTTSIKKTSSHSSLPQHIQLTTTPASGLNISLGKHAYAFKREGEHRQRLWWAKSVLFEVMKDTRCSNTPKNVLVEERKQEHQILQTCFYLSHLIPLFSSTHLPSLVFYYIQCLTIMNNMKWFEKVCRK